MLLEVDAHPDQEGQFVDHPGFQVHHPPPQGHSLRGLHLLAWTGSTFSQVASRPFLVPQRGKRPFAAEQVIVIEVEGSPALILNQVTVLRPLLTKFNQILPPFLTQFLKNALVGDDRLPRLCLVANSRGWFLPESALLGVEILNQGFVCDRIVGFLGKRIKIVVDLVGGLMSMGVDVSCMLVVGLVRV